MREDIRRAIEDAMDVDELVELLDLTIEDLLDGSVEEIIETNLDRVLEYIGYEQSDDADDEV